MTTQTIQTINTINLIVRVISDKFEKHYVSISESDAVLLESIGGNVKRVVNERFGPSCQIAIKFAPDWMQRPEYLTKQQIRVGFSYTVVISPYKYNYKGVEGISLQSMFLTELPRDDVVRPRLLI